MTEDEAQMLAAKREKNKPKTLSHKRWAPQHNSVKGWHVALIDYVDPKVEMQKHQQARKDAMFALATGNTEQFFEAAHNSLMAKVRAELASSED